MIPESSLSLGAVIGSGGFADTLLVTGKVGRGLPADLVYKRWRAGASPQDTRHVTRLVEFRSRLSGAEQAFLDGVAAWPVELVGTGGTASGFLMPRAPKVFMYHDQARGFTTAAVSLLYAKAQRGRKAGAFVPSDSDLVSRLTIVAQLAYALKWLHDRGAVFGDLSHANEVFTIKGQPRVYLIDTDGISIPASRIVQPDTPSYIPPEASRLGGMATPETDVYKFALVLVRILAHPRQQLSQTASPDFLIGILDQEGLDLVARGLSIQPQDRPTLTEFYEYLYRFVGAQLSPPRILQVSLDPEFALEGDLVRVGVHADGALGVTVRSPEGEVIGRDLTGPRPTASFRAGTGGRVSVEAVNDHGTATASSPILHVLPPVAAPSRSRTTPGRPGWVSAPGQSAAVARDVPASTRPPVAGADELRRQPGWRGESCRNWGDPRHYPVRTPIGARRP